MARVVEIDAETAEFREQIQMVQRDIQFGNQLAIQEYGSIESTNQILT